ncbi:MAG: HNH endonuclease signature motif containing protein [Acidimicrobiales bacterium]|nr:HNH endonuclease signature motif containing protein [Acidimicrobiales bacterium]
MLFVLERPEPVDDRMQLFVGPLEPGVLVSRREEVPGAARVDIEAEPKPGAETRPEWMRTAITVQSRGACERKGCDAPHTWLQMDHIDPVANGGPTRFDNTQAGCRPDNQAKGATTGCTPWRDQPPPPRRKLRRQQHRASTTSDTSDDDPHADTAIF